jgi:hypothetical protein
LIAMGEGRGAPLPEPTSAASQWVDFHGVPFVTAPEDGIDVHMSDPRQGQLGDCYFIAGMIAVARTKPDAIRAMIAEQGDGNYVVTLRGAGTYLYLLPADVRVEVDQRYPAGGAGKPVYAKLADEEEVDGQVRYELWPMMLERAYAQHRGGYAKMENGWPGTGGREGHRALGREDDRRADPRRARPRARGGPARVGRVRPQGPRTDRSGHERRRAPRLRHHRIARRRLPAAQPVGLVAPAAADHAGGAARHGTEARGG